MYRKNVSGQCCYFGLFNTASGLPITSGASAIVAKKALDGGAQATCSGVITEPGSGQYCFQGWASDFNGNFIGLMFTASGAAPTHYNIATTNADPTNGTNFGLSCLASGLPNTSGGFPLQGGSIPNALTSLSGGLPTVGPGSGQFAPVASGMVLAALVYDKSGYSLSASGLDTITVETGMNFRQAQAAIAASVAGRLSGAGTTSIKMDGANASGTLRINAVVDASGNRSVVTLSLPV